MPPLVDQLPEALWNEIKPVFAAAFPKEAVVATHGSKWRQIENVSNDPVFGFAISHADKAKLLNRPPTLFLHSHPNGSAEPSDMDTIQQLESGWNWGIVAVTGNTQGDVYDVAYPECWGPDIAIPELLGRSYLWGIRDCWTLCRDWLRLNEKDVANMPRARDPGIYPAGHWGNDQFTYWPPKLGFKLVARHERKPGDIAVMQMMANRYNHCAVYLGEGKYLHQQEKHLSEYWIPLNEEKTIERFNMVYYRLK